MGYHKVKIGDAVKVALSVAVSAGLVVWLFHKVDFHKVMAIIREGIDYRYIAAMMLLTVLSHVIRGVRWGIQLRAAGIPRIPVLAESVSIFGAYALNLVFPFLGEAWRCVYISDREKCALSTVVGTDLGDRASDGLMILLLVGLTTVVARGAIDSFLDRYPAGEAIDRVVADGTVWLWVLAVAVVLAIAHRLLRHTAFIGGVDRSARRMWDGFRVLFHMKGTGLYIVLTFGIWICYYLETYVCFFAFPFTRSLVFRTPAGAGGVRVRVVQHGHPLRRRSRSVEYSRDVCPQPLRHKRQRGCGLFHHLLELPGPYARGLRNLQRGLHHGLAPPREGGFYRSFISGRCQP